MKTCRISIIPTKPTKLIYQTHQNINKTIFPYHNLNTKSKKTRARNLKYIENKWKPIPFLEDWWRINEENGGFGRGRGRQDNKGARDMRETKIFLKIVLDLTLFVQNMQFSRLDWLARKSPKWVAKIPWTKFWKFCLKCFSGLEGPLASKSQRKSRILLCKLVTWASTREQVAKLSREIPKNPEILKIF